MVLGVRGGKTHRNLTEPVRSKGRTSRSLLPASLLLSLQNEWSFSENIRVVVVVVVAVVVATVTSIKPSSLFDAMMMIMMMMMMTRFHRFRRNKTPLPSSFYSFSSTSSNEDARGDVIDDDDAFTAVSRRI